MGAIQREASKMGNATGTAMSNEMAGAIDKSGRGGVLSRAVGGIGKSLVAGFAAFGAANVFGGFIREAEEAAKVGRLTEAVLKSTGGVAGVTAGDVDKLSDALSRKSGVDDDVIASGQNVLLTFTKVANEAGAGNDIFNQATSIALDMSTALGTDLQGSVIQVGKALNDPIKGLTALSRVGVSFTEQQKAQIETLVASGDVLGAQKVILAELNTEFGGAAEAGATASGKLSVAWGNFQEAIGEKLMPIFASVTEWLADKLPVAVDIGSRVFSAIGGVVADVFPTLRDITVGAFSAISGFVQEHWPAFRDLVVGAFNAIAGWVRENWPGFRDMVLDVFTAVADWLRENWPGIQEFLLGVFRAVAGWVQANWPGFRDLVLGVFQAIGEWLDANWPAIQEFLLGVFRAVHDWLVENWPGIRDTVLNVLGAIADWVAAVWPGIRDTVVNVLSAIVGWVQDNWPTIRNVIETTFNIIVDIVTTAVDVIAGIIRTAIDVWNVAWRVVEVAVQIVTDYLVKPLRAIIETLVDVISGIIEAGVATWNGIWAAVEGIVTFFNDYVYQPLSSAVEAMASFITDVVAGLVDVVSTIWSGMEVVFTFFRDYVWNPLAAGVDTMADGIKLAIGGLVGVVKTTWSGIEAVYHFFRDNVAAPIGNAVEGLRKAVVTAFDLAVAGVRNAWEALKSVVKQPINAVIGFYNFGIRGIWNNVISKIPGVGDLPAVSYLNSGGRVPGVGDKDTVPALLTPGEFVITKKAAATWGPKVLEQLNDPRGTIDPAVFGYAKGGWVQRFASGGYVAEDQLPLRSPSGARVADYEKGRGLYFDGWTYSSRGWGQTSLRPGVNWWPAHHPFGPRQGISNGVATYVGGWTFGPSGWQRGAPQRASGAMGRRGGPRPMFRSWAERMAWYGNRGNRPVFRSWAERLAYYGGRAGRYAAGGYARSPAEAAQWARAQAGKPYQYPMVGPSQYDCCHPGDVRVHGPQGAVRMDEIRPGNVVWSYVDGNLEPHEVVAAAKSTVQLVYRVVMNGHMVRASGNHPFLRLRRAGNTTRHVKASEGQALTERAKRGSMINAVCAIDICDDPVLARGLCVRHYQRWRAHGDPRYVMTTGTDYDVEWANVDDLRPGDLVVTTTHGTPEVTDGEPFLPDGTPVTNDVAWLLGLLVGDGTVGSRGFRVYVFDAVADRAAAVIEDTWGRTACRYPHALERGVLFNSTTVGEMLCDLGMKVPGPQKRIPAVVWSWPRKQQQAFLDGYCDADGHRPADQARHGERTYASASPNLIADVRAMHQMHGDSVGNTSVTAQRPAVIKGKVVQSSNPLHTFTVWRGRRTGESNLRQRPALAKLLDSWGGAFTLRRVKDIIPDGVEQTYDIEVEGAHNYIADGVVVSNSGLTSAIINYILGQNPHRRRHSSSSISGDPAVRRGAGPGTGLTLGAKSAYTTNRQGARVGHIAGTINGMNFEATPPRVRVGAGARGANSALFTSRWHLPGYGTGAALTGGGGPGGGNIFAGASASGTVAEVADPGVVAAIKSLIGMVVTGAGGGPIGDILTKMINRLPGIIYDFFIKKMPAIIVDAVKEAVGNVANVGGANRSTGSTFRQRELGGGFATGGTIGYDGPALVGEHRPEIIHANRGQYVQANMPGGELGGDVHLHVHGDIVGDEAWRRTVRTELQRGFREQHDRLLAGSRH